MLRAIILKFEVLQKIPYSNNWEMYVFILRLISSLLRNSPDIRRADIPLE
jgi:hypothetical protein